MKRITLNISLIFFTLLFILSSASLSSQWTNNAGLTSHDHPTDDLLLSGSSMTGGGAKLFYDAGKFAFRGGVITNANTNWNTDSLGLFSFSFGNNTKANGVYSFAFGDQTKATGNFSLAIGTQAESQTDNAVAIGFHSIASGFSSISLGQSSEASGSGAVSLGTGNLSTGSNSVAIGNFNESAGSNSTALGGLCKASGDLGSTSVGYLSESTQNKAIAIGYKTKASAVNSFTIGSGTGASGAYLENTIENSLIIGFNSTTPTVFVGPAIGSIPGKVGIGTTTPSSTLEVNGAVKLGNQSTPAENGTIRYTGTAFEGYSNGWIPFSSTSDNWGTQVVQSSSELTGNGTNMSVLSIAQQGAQTGQVLEWNGTSWTPANDDQGSVVWNVVGNDINYTTGFVGMGTATPQEELHIESVMPELKFTTPNTGSNANDGFEIGVNTGAGNVRAKLWQFEDGHMVFGTNNLERMRIHKTGSVGIGTTGIPQQQLDIIGAINIGTTTAGTAGALRFDGTDFEGYDGSSWKSLTSSGDTSIWSADNLDVFFDAPGGKVAIGTITPTEALHVEGNIAITGEIKHPSDKRLKTNISELKDALAIINSLSAKTYNYKAEGIEEFKLSDRKQFGFIAQELQEVLPTLVSNDLFIAEDGRSYMGLNYEQLIPILVQALKEEHKQKIMLKAELDDLKSENRQKFNAINADLAKIYESIKQNNTDLSAEQE